MLPAMRKIKIFSDASERLIELAVNRWLAEHRAVIIFNTLQSECYSVGLNSRALTITIFYYEGEQG